MINEFDVGYYFSPDKKIIALKVSKDDGIYVESKEVFLYSNNLSNYLIKVDNSIYEKLDVKLKSIIFKKEDLIPKAVILKIKLFLKVDSSIIEKPKKDIPSIKNGVFLFNDLKLKEKFIIGIDRHKNSQITTIIHNGGEIKLTSLSNNTHKLIENLLFNDKNESRL